jgi:hypothetical protein
MAHFSNAELAQKLSDLVDFWSSFNEEYANWLGGTVTGGPSSDGKYPLTDYTGTESLVECPAKLSDTVGGYADAADASATAAAASAAAASTSETNAAASAATATAQAALADADRIAAGVSETNADGSATTATTQANLATDRAGYASEWAITVEDTLVSVAAGGDGATDYSALHWAAKTAIDAIATAADAVSTDADATAAAASAAAAAASAASIDPVLLFTLADDELVSGRPAFNGGTSGVDSPFTVDSTFLVSNLNADLLDGNEASAFESADATILKDADIGVTVQAYDATYLVDADIGVNVQAYDADLTTWAGITPSANAQALVGAATYAAMRTLLDLEAGTDFYSIAAADAAFEAADATILKDADIGVNVLAYSASVVYDADFASNGILKRISAGVYGIVADASANWNTAYGWGDHSGLYEAADADIVKADVAETIAAIWTHSANLIMSSGADTATLSMSASQFQLESTQHILLNPAAGHQVYVFDSGQAAQFAIYDGTGSDYVTHYHDGTDFNKDAAGTTDVNNTGITGFYKYDATVQLSVGGFKPEVVSTTELEDITSTVNTSNNKVNGAIYFNNTTNQLVIAQGNTDGAVWKDAVGTTVHTPVTP